MSKPDLASLKANVVRQKSEEVTKLSNQNPIRLQLQETQTVTHVKFHSEVTMNSTVPCSRLRLVAKYYLDPG